MRSTFLDPGRLRTELSLQTATRVSDGQGGSNETWEEVASVFALLEPSEAQPFFGADQPLETVTHRVTLRTRADVVRGMRFVKGTRKFLILSVLDPDESGRFLVCRTEEARP